MIPDNVPTFQLPADAKQGTYRIRLKLHDAVSDKTTTAEMKLDVREWAIPADGMESAVDMIRYHRAFSPDLLHRIAFDRNASIRHKDDNTAYDFVYLSFIQHAYAGRAFMIDEYLRRFKTMDRDQRERVLLILKLTGHDPIPEDKRTAEDDAFLKSIADLAPRDPQGEIQSPADVDSLWGQYMATGEYQPVRHLLDALAWHDEGDYADKVTDSGKMPDTESGMARLQRGLAFKDCVRILSVNCLQDELLAEYCAKALEGNDLDRSARAFVTVILSNRWPEVYTLGSK
jgi:hypothetical protein